jgi:carbonic anhydrase
VTDNAIQKLIDGFGRFRARHFATGNHLYRRLTREGQAPQIMVIACCDSRVDPAIVTDCDPGDLFVVRNVANLVPPFETGGHYHGTSAALEFAVRVLSVRHVVVFGHAHCGGIRALIGGIPGEGDVGQFIRPWMEIATEARVPGGTDDQAARATEQAAIRVSLRNLMSFPWVAERVADGRLALHGWYFDLDQGELLRYNADQDRYLALR